MFWAESKKWVMLAAVAAAMAGALPLQAQTGGLQGDCIDAKGDPYVKYTVRIERQDIKGVYNVKTDKKGHYIYIGLPLGNYKVTLADPNGREIYNFKGVHVGIGDPVEQDFDMKKEQAAQAEEAKSNPEMQKQLQQQKAQAEDQKQFTGLKQYFDQGNAFYNDKKFPEAVDMFEKAIPFAKDRNLVAVETRLADSYSGAHQYDKAVETYQKVISLDPANAELHNSLGSAYAQMNKIPGGAGGI